MLLAIKQIRPAYAFALLLFLWLSGYSFLQTIFTSPVNTKFVTVSARCNKTGPTSTLKLCQLFKLKCNLALNYIFNLPLTVKFSIFFLFIKPLQTGVLSLIFKPPRI